MAGMLDLADVFELVDDGLDDGALAQEQLVREGEQALVHVRVQLGDQAQAQGDEKVSGQGLRDAALVSKELAEQAAHQTRHRAPIIDVARRKAEGQQLAAIADDQMQLEAIEPADRGLATGGVDGEYVMLADARIAADGLRRRIDEADAGARPKLSMQLDTQWYQHAGDELDEARVAHELGNSSRTCCWTCPVENALKVRSCDC
jgi:hypothetical protein